MDTTSRTKRFPATLSAKIAHDAPPHGKHIRSNTLQKQSFEDSKIPSSSLASQASQVNAVKTTAQHTSRKAPAGVGLDSSAVRARMVQRLRQAQLAPESILAAIEAVPRHDFVDAALAAQAYEDTALPIGHGQTISKPSSVARLLAAANIHAHKHKQARVLDIGTGCGYQAAVLAQMCKEVVSIERFRDLHEKARMNLRRIGVLGIHGVRLVHGDAVTINAGYGQFDAIISAASAASLELIPSAWIERLAVGGVLVAPVGQAEQKLLRIVKLGETPLDIQTQLLEAVKFVPLQSGKL